MNTNYRIVQYAYPEPYRGRRFPELVDTANELAPNGWSARQSWSLLTGGLRHRARLAASAEAAGVWPAGVRLGLFLWLFAAAVFPVASALHSVGLVSRGEVWGGPGLSFSLIFVLLPLVALVLRTSWPTALLVTIAEVRSLFLAETTSSGAAAIVTAVMVIGGAWWLAIRSNGARAVRPRWALLHAGGFLLVAAGFGLGTAMVAHYANTMLLFGLVGLLLAPFDPRPIVAATVLWVLQTPALIWVFYEPAASQPAGASAIVPVMLGMVVIGVAASWFGTKRLVRL